MGGATTDVYSVAKGAPTNSAVHFIGLPEPYAKRTVEGDLGLYHNLDTLKAIAELDELPAGFEEAVAAMCSGEQRAHTGNSRPRAICFSRRRRSGRR